MADTVRYAYAVTRDLDDAGLVEQRGLRGSPLEVVSVGGLDAVVSDVPLEEFSEEGLRSNLEDLSWLEEVARAHDEVVRLVAAQRPTAPLRLATIFLDDSAVRARLQEWADQIGAALDRVEGREEWSVKVIAPAEVPESPEPAPTTGREFLQRRKAQVEDRGARFADVARAAEEVHRALASCAAATRLLAAQDPQLTGLTGTMALNGAYLVDDADQQAFQQHVSDLRDRFPDVVLECAGPWPPYSFAVLEQP